MNPNAIGGDWVAAYQDWMDCDEGIACSSEETAIAYLEWNAAAPAARAEKFVGDTLTLDALRESMLVAALRTEADYLHILRRAMDAGDAAFPARKLVVDALSQAEKLLEDEQRAWVALMGPRPPALEGVAADVHALAGRLLELQLH